MQGELAKAMVERDQLLSFVGDDDQRVVQADRRIDAIEKRIDAERSALGAEGPGTTLPDVVGTYEELKVDLEFAQRRLYPGARRRDRRPRRGAAPVALSRAARHADLGRGLALSPRALLSGLALLFLSLGWGILMLFYYNVRDGNR